MFGDSDRRALCLFKSIFDPSKTTAWEFCKNWITNSVRSLFTKSRSGWQSRTRPCPPLLIAPINKGGHGLDAQWSDDFHHSLHCVLTGENKGYYEDFGTLKCLATAIEERFVYSNQYSTHRKRQHGNSAKIGSPTQFVVYSQNHDQVGNRAQGDRLSTLLSFNALKVTAATVLLSQNIPLLFMGEEYGETAPFLYFIDHGDPGLIEAVRQGRKADYVAFGWSDVPDPYAQETYDRSHLQWDKPHSQEQTYLLNWYQELIKLRKTIPALGPGKKSDKLKVQTHSKAQVLTIHRTCAFYG